MPSHTAPASVLGASWAEAEHWGVKQTGFLGLRSETVASPIRFLDWTVDGKPLRNRLAFANGMPCRDVTFLTEGSEGDRFAIESLRALLGESDSPLDPWVQYSDGRAGVLFCPQCGDLGCGAVSVEVAIVEDRVEWRDIAYQDGMTEAIYTEEVPAFSLSFRPGDV